MFFVFAGTVLSNTNSEPSCVIANALDVLDALARINETNHIPTTVN